MQPVYIDLHIHTYPDANNRTTDYDIVTLVRKIKEYNGDEPFLISFTDHNTINRDVYLAAKAVGVNRTAHKEPRRRRGLPLPYLFQLGCYEGEH